MRPRESVRAGRELEGQGVQEPGVPDDALQMPEFKGQLSHLLAGCVLLGKFNSRLCAFVLLFDRVIVTEPDSTDLLGSLLSSVHRPGQHLGLLVMGTFYNSLTGETWRGGPLRAWPPSDTSCFSLQVK